MSRSSHIIITIALFFASVITTFSQQSINNYKYVVVPKKYDFLNAEDKYQINSLTKFLFDKYGFTTFTQGEEFPEDLKNNNCLAMYANVEEIKAFLRTKLRIDLKDCNGNLIQSSREGLSREKEFEKSFNLALRDAFYTFQHAEYKYEPKTATTTSVATTDTAAEVERLKKELQTLKAEQKPVQVTEQVKDVVKEDIKNDVVEEVETAADVKGLPVLYAQPIENGFQLVDSTPKVIYKIRKTSSPEMFIVETINGMLAKKTNGWLLEYYDNGVLKTEMLNIKF